MTEKHIDEDNCDSSLTGADLKDRRTANHKFVSNVLLGAILASVFFALLNAVPNVSVILLWIVVFVALNKYVELS